MSCKFKREDQVLVISGKSKGSKGKIIQILKNNESVLIEGVNKAKKHEKPSQTNEQGGIVEKEMPVHISNIMLISPKSSKPVKVVYRKNDNGKRIRVEKKNPKNIID